MKIVAIALSGLAACSLVAREMPEIPLPEGVAGAEVIQPLESAEAWKPGDEDAWAWKPGGVLAQERQSEVKPEVRSPVNLAWFDAAEFRNFELTAELRLTTFNRGNNDLCIAFGGSDETHFYYAHLGQKADEPHHQIHVVDGADREPVTTARTGGTPWQEGRWHEVRLVRDAGSGAIGVWFDGEMVLAAEDKRFEWGKIGLGSFDDTGEFRKVAIRGETR